MKRTREEFSDTENTVSDINNDFLEECEEEFNSNPSNIMSRNAIVSVGSMLATTNSNRLNDINHIFLNTLKKKHIKATNQGRSGRCWMFSGLNMFRHSIINALGLTEFEFSETYLFFYDKLERSNSYLRWFIDHPDIKKGDKEFDHIVSDYTTDGGWWNTFSNLVKKYGLVPKSAMKETFQSDDSEDMNKIIEERIQSCANYIFSNKKLSFTEKIEEKDKTVKQIYSILVKFLGEPPKKFKWSYTTDEEESNIIQDLTPLTYMKIVIPDIDMDDFVVLSHIPDTLKYNQMYEVNYSNNVYEGQNFTFLNLPMSELVKYTKKSILSGLPVWFASDVGKDFNPYHSSLDDKLIDNNLVFGEQHEFSKSDRITFKNVQANHAMSIIGLNLDKNDVPDSWQVENSWGYIDNETAGLDGFLYMSHSWFLKNVLQVVIHKNYLSRNIKKYLNTTTIMLNPWDSIAPALKIKNIQKPKFYEKK
jgi:bleomycin hydrolase